MLVSIKLQSVKFWPLGANFQGPIGPQFILSWPLIVLSRGQLCLVELAPDIKLDCYVESLRVILVCTITMVLVRSKFKP